MQAKCLNSFRFKSGYRFDQHVFKPGEYVSIKEHDGETRTFKVVAVD